MAAARGMSLQVACKAAVRTRDPALVELLAGMLSRRAGLRLVERGRGKDDFKDGVVAAKDAPFLAELQVCNCLRTRVSL